MIGWLTAQFAKSRVGGLTGDIYGGINMMVEASVLLVFAAAS